MGCVYCSVNLRGAHCPPIPPPNSSPRRDLPKKGWGGPPDVKNLKSGASGKGQDKRDQVREGGSNHEEGESEALEYGA